MKRTAAAVAAFTGALALAGGAVAAFGSTNSQASRRDAGSEAPGSGRSVVEWNQELVSILKTPGTQPATVHPTRSYTILHGAIYDAVVSITHGDSPFVFEVTADSRARPDAAADQAAHDVLANLYPAQRPALDNLLAGQLGSLPPGPATANGRRVGHLAATLMLGLRSDDGSAVTPPTFTLAPPAPGNYQITPPNHPAPVFTNWANVTPFVLDRGDQFRPTPPPALTSPAWAQAINEVQSLGRDTSMTRTPDQTNAGKFWAPPIWNTWNQIADDQATVRHTNLEQTARLLADLNLSLADTTIGLYDAKYHYLFWRPITAIRSGTPNNPAVTGDPNWNALANTAADPSYPGAHSSLSSAAATVLTAFFGNHVDLTVSTDTPVGGPRHFASFQAAAVEAGLSRIYAGQHTRLDHDAGVILGTDVARTVLQSLGASDR